MSEVAGWRLGPKVSLRKLFSETFISLILAPAVIGVVGLAAEGIGAGELTRPEKPMFNAAGWLLLALIIAVLAVVLVPTIRTWALLAFSKVSPELLLDDELDLSQLKPRPEALVSFASFRKPMGSGGEHSRTDFESYQPMVWLRTFRTLTGHIPNRLYLLASEKSLPAAEAFGSECALEFPSTEIQIIDGVDPNDLAVVEARLAEALRSAEDAGIDPSRVAIDITGGTSVASAAMFAAGQRARATVTAIRQSLEAELADKDRIVVLIRGGRR